MSERDPDRERDEPEPAVDGGTGPGVSPGDVETPGAATTPNAPDRDDDGGRREAVNPDDDTAGDES